MLKTDESIIADLRRLARTGQPVELLNVYQGIPVLYRAVVEKAGADRVVVQFEQPEAICLTLENKTTILSDVLAGPVNTAVLEVDLPGGTATLAKFRYAYSRVGDRMTLRVAPHAPVAVIINSGQQAVSGTLADVSMSGVGVVVAPPAEAETLRRQAVVQLALSLDDTPLALSGTVHYLKNEANACRVGVKLVQTSQARTLVQYLHRRQEEILRELHARYEAALAQRASE